MLRILLWLLIAIGTALCGYLLWRHIQVFSEAEGAGRDVCSAVFGRGCDATLESPLSVQLGLPLAGWGVVYFGVLIALLGLGRAIGPGFEAQATLAASGLAITAAVASIVLAGTMATGLAPVCPLCLAVHAVNITLTALLLPRGMRSLRQLVSEVKLAAALVARGEAPGHAASRWPLVGFLAAALVGVVLYQWVFIEVQLHDASLPELDPQRLVAQFTAAPRQQIPVEAEDSKLGPDDAPARLVVFSDFQCAACRRFALQMGSLRERFGGRLLIVFKHFPLSTRCNSAVTRDLHPQACQCAWAAEAARRQDLFWPVHDALFASRGRDSLAIVERLAAAQRLDENRLNADLTAQATRAKVQADVDLGQRLGVDSTPAIFLNGRRLPSTRLRSVAFLIEHELQRADTK